MSDNDKLAHLLAKLFVQRKDVKALQVLDGGYRPVRENWIMKDFRDHVNGERTFGHYTCDAEGLTKVIVFDIDLETGYCKLKKNGQPLPQCCAEGHGTWFEEPGDEILADVQDWNDFMDQSNVHPSHPREEWRDRKHPARAWYKFQFRTLMDVLTATIKEQFDFNCAAAYSGNKGCHVYAFLPEPMPAKAARRAALLILEAAGMKLSPNHQFVPYKGSNFFKFEVPDDPWYDLSNLSVEIFPKQDSMEDKDLGNLVRLPLGVNHKGPKYKTRTKIINEPTFFIDQRLSQRELAPHPDPVALLESGNPYAS